MRWCGHWARPSVWLTGGPIKSHSCSVWLDSCYTEPCVLIVLVYDSCLCYILFCLSSVSLSLFFVFSLCVSLWSLRSFLWWSCKCPVGRKAGTGGCNLCNTASVSMVLYSLHQTIAYFLSDLASYMCFSQIFRMVLFRAPRLWGLASRASGEGWGSWMVCLQAPHPGISWHSPTFFWFVVLLKELDKPLIWMVNSKRIEMVHLLPL